MRLSFGPSPSWLGLRWFIVNLVQNPELPGETRRDIPIEEQSDETDDDVFSASGDDDGSEPDVESTDEESDIEVEPVPAQPGAGAVAVTRQLDLEARVTRARVTMANQIQCIRKCTHVCPD